ncbi:MAG: mechanosensitive ion channel family protein [Flavobacterium sp.]
MKEILVEIKEFLGFSLYHSSQVNITVGLILALLIALILTRIVLKIIRKFITQKLPSEDKSKFVGIFQFIQYLVYVFVVMFTLNAAGVNISVLLTASAAIFIGLGFALQQLFQDVISGVLIILDQSLHVGDIIEINNRVCKVEKISLRSTKAVTRNNRVMVIPNHKFLTDVIINWTQNSTDVRDFVKVGVAYGSDTKLVEQLLLQCANRHPEVLPNPKPMVFFEDFGDSALVFSLYFYVSEGFKLPKIQSEVRFAIDQAFRSNKITIPFPQRDVHVVEKKGF